MSLRNCAECGKVFVFVKRSICPDCLDKEEQMFDKVRDYLKDYPGAKITEVSKATEVPEEKIIRFLRDGRIESTSLNTGLACESCGAPISSGRHCDKCTEDLRRGIQSITKNIKFTAEDQKPLDPTNKGMHIADRHKK